MEPITHVLTGMTLARAGANRLAPLATPALIAGALLPNIDALFTYWGKPTYLQLHIGWTHSLLGSATLAALLAFPFWRWARQHQPQSQLFLKLFLASWLGLASHLLLDWTNSYGVRFFWPLDPTWYALDWFHVVDPWVLAVLTLGLAAPALLRLISEEIGARATAAGGQRGAWTAIVLLLGLCAVRGPLHAQAVETLGARMYRGRTPLRVGAFPASLNPFVWYGVAETDSTYELVTLRLAGPERGMAPEFAFYKPQPAPAVEAARASFTGNTFLDFARFPLLRVETTSQGYRVWMRDVGFVHATSRRRNFRAYIYFDHSLQVINEEFRVKAEGGVP